MFLFSPLADQNWEYSFYSSKFYHTLELFLTSVQKKNAFLEAVENTGIRNRLTRKEGGSVREH